GQIAGNTTFYAADLSSAHRDRWPKGRPPPFRIGTRPLDHVPPIPHALARRRGCLIGTPSDHVRPDARARKLRKRQRCPSPRPGRGAFAFWGGDNGLRTSAPLRFSNGRI